MFDFFKFPNNILHSRLKGASMGDMSLLGGLYRC